MHSLAIVDSNYPRDPTVAGMAATWLRWELRRAGRAETDPASAEILLCTVSSPQGVKDLQRCLRQIGNKTARVILGGGGAYAPAVFDPIIHAACVGEGPRFMRTLLTDGLEAATALPEVWVPNETRPVIPARDFPWDLPPVNHPDGTVRLFASRGCRFRCLFCQTGWENSYRPTPHPAVLAAQAQALVQSGRRVAIVTNDAAEKGMPRISGQAFMSARVDNLAALEPLSRQFVKNIRFGVEGVSERLRRAVGKPILNDELLEMSAGLLARGIGVTWFFITGLPGEHDDDYLELRYLVTRLKALSKGCIMMVFHAFIPQPATPLCVPALEDAYWEPFDEFRRWFFHGPGFTRRVQIMAPSKYPFRLRRAKESMAATEYDLRRGWWSRDNPNWRVQYLVAPDKLRSLAESYLSALDRKQLKAKLEKTCAKKKAKR